MHDDFLVARLLESLLACTSVAIFLCKSISDCISRSGVVSCDGCISFCLAEPCDRSRICSLSIPMVDDLGSEEKIVGGVVGSVDEMHGLAFKLPGDLDGCDASM